LQKELKRGRKSDVVIVAERLPSFTRQSKATTKQHKLVVGKIWCREIRLANICWIQGSLS
jgi:hypothetical protein